MPPKLLVFALDPLRWNAAAINSSDCSLGMTVPLWKGIIISGPRSLPRKAGLDYWATVGAEEVSARLKEDKSTLFSGLFAPYNIRVHLLHLSIP